MSRRRRPITSPPGGGTTARPKRASSGPASRNEARISRARARGRARCFEIAGAWTRTSFGAGPRDVGAEVARAARASPRRRGCAARSRASPPRRSSTRRGEDRQGAVLVPGGADRAGERATALDDERLHERGAAIATGTLAMWSRPASRPGTTLTRYTKSESLLRHALAVEASTRWYARHFGEDEELWGVTALLHDFDYEIHPTLDKHPQDGAPILREEGYPEVVIEAVLSHAEHLAIPRDTPLQEDAVRLRRALRLRPRVRARAADRPRGPRAEVGEEEAEAAVVRGRRAPRRGLRGRRAARARARRAHRERRRRAAADRGRARPAHLRPDAAPVRLSASAGRRGLAVPGRP